MTLKECHNGTDGNSVIFLKMSSSLTTDSLSWADYLPFTQLDETSMIRYSFQLQSREVAIGWQYARLSLENLKVCLPLGIYWSCSYLETFPILLTTKLGIWYSFSRTGWFLSSWTIFGLIFIRIQGRNWNRVCYARRIMLFLSFNITIQFTPDFLYLPRFLTP